MNVVKEIIDIMGGLDYEVDVEVNIGGRKLEKGFQHLNGQQVLDYARTRHTGRGDIDRIGRQQKIVLAVFDQLKSTKQIAKVPQFYSAIMDKVHTNMNLKQIVALALFAAKLEKDNIETYTVPGGFVNLGGVSYWGIDQYKKKELVAQIFGIDIEVDPTQDLKYLKERMEEERKIWMEAVQKGQAAINVGNGTLVAYGECIKDDERVRLEMIIHLIENYIEEGDMEGIYKEAEELYKQNDIILPLAISRYNTIKNARAVIADVNNKIESNRALLLKDEEDGLRDRIDKVEQSITAKDVQAIQEAVANLTDYAKVVFSSCEQRRNEQNTKQSPKQEETPEQHPNQNEPTGQEMPNQQQPNQEQQSQELPQEQESTEHDKPLESQLSEELLSEPSPGEQESSAKLGVD